MKTHIIIPIADIYKMIQDYNKLVQEAAKDRTDNGKFNFVRYGAKSSVLTKLLLETGKQISLDEKDIEEKANQYAGNGNWELFEDDNFNIRKEAFKQALNELL